MKSLDKALQNIKTWLLEAQKTNVEQSYKLWRENGVWQSKINEEN